MWLLPKLVWLTRAKRPRVLLTCLLGVAGLAGQTHPQDNLPSGLASAARRMLLAQPDSLAFHVHATFHVVSDLGTRSEGSITEDWWSEQWWRRIIVVNGKKVETRNVNGRRLHMQDDGFFLPFTAQNLLNSAFDPFPKGQTGKPLPEERIETNGTLLRCTPVPGGSSPIAGLRPELQNFCVDAAGDLRILANSRFRVAYNDLRDFATRKVARHVRILRGGERVGELRVDELSERPDGLRDLQNAAVDEQIEFALAPEHPTVLLTARQMQRQMISSDIHMLPASPDWPLKRGQNFAIIRVLQSDGRLLDAEVLNSSDTATRTLALGVLQHVKFTSHAWHDRPLMLEGVVMLVKPS